MSCAGNIGLVEVVSRVRLLLGPASEYAHVEGEGGCGDGRERDGKRWELEKVDLSVSCVLSTSCSAP